MDQLFKPLLRLLESAENVDEIRFVLVKVAWNRVAGDTLRQHAIAVALRGQTLTVAVADAVWQKQLESMARQLLYRLGALVGQTLVTYLEFKIDPAAFKSAGNASRHVVDRHSAKVPVELVSAAAAIEDPKLRRLFLGAATSAMSRVEEGRKR